MDARSGNQEERNKTSAAGKEAVKQAPEEMARGWWAAENMRMCSQAA